MFNKKNLLLALVFLPWALSAQFSISGKIISADEGDALAGAHVALTQKAYHQIADAEGRFEFKNIKPGKYELRFPF